MLGKKGRKVLLLERNDRIGGCLRTEEITAPGFIHDVMAMTLVLFLTSPAYGAIGKDLEARGFEVAHSDLPTGVIRPDGSHVLFSRDRARNVATFEACAKGDGETFAREMDRMGADAPFLFALLGGRLWSRQTAMLIAREAWKRGPRRARGLVRRGAAALRGTIWNRPMRRRRFTRSGRPGACTAASIPRAPIRRQMVKVIAFAIEMAGCPIAVGGAKTLRRRLRAAHRRQWRAGAVRRGCRAHRDRGRGRARAGRAARVGRTHRSRCRASSAR